MVARHSIADTGLNPSASRKDKTEMVEQALAHINGMFTFQDLSYGLTDTSRLGCQVCMSKELSGMEVRVPQGVRDQRNA